MIRAQFDLQKRIESQMITLQTVMQAVCRLVSDDTMSSKINEGHSSSKQLGRDQRDFQLDESHKSWSSNIPAPHFVSENTTNALNELLMLSRQMCNGKITFTNSFLSKEMYQIMNPTIQKCLNLIFLIQRISIRRPLFVFSKSLFYVL